MSMLGMLALAAAVQAGPSAPAVADGGPLPEGVVAVWDGGRLDEDRFARWLGETFARVPDVGGPALRHLVQLQVVRNEAAKRGLTADPAAVEARIAEARAAVEEAGMDLDRVLRERDLTPAAFRELIADSLLHEAMVRHDLGLAPDAPVTAEQLQAWSEERVQAVLDAAPPPNGGWALDAPPYRVDLGELGHTILVTSSPARLREWVKARVLLEALPRWGAAHGLTLSDRDLMDEIEWRRRRVAENPNYGGATYDALLASRGSSVESVLAGDEIRVAAWMRAYARHRYPDAWFDALSAEDRAALERRFGPTREVWWVLVHATDQPDDPLDLSFDEAEEQLRGWAAEVADRADFEDLARRYSEDERTRKRGGHLGWVHEEERGVDPKLTAAVFAADGPGLHGPVRLGDGVALLWLGPVRPAPAEPAFREAVRRSFRNRLEDEFLASLHLRTRWDEGP